MLDTTWERWAALATGQTVPPVPHRGDLINARARAGAALADAEAALARIPRAATLLRQMAEEQVDRARRAYEDARQAERG